MVNRDSLALRFRRFCAHNRILVLFFAVLAVMTVVAPGFATPGNAAAILRGVSINALLVTGLTVVFIVRQMDLSFAAVLTFGAMVAVSVQPRFGWIGAFAAAGAVGLAVGLVNGFLVTKAKVDSFIATLGTMMVFIGVAPQFSNGGTLNLQDFEASHWVGTSLLGQGTWLGCLLSPLVLAALGVVLLFELFLKRTVTGRSLFLVGGNPKTAWYSGLPIGRLTMCAFVTSGVLAGLAGALTVTKLNSASPGLGAPSLMVVIAAVIVGGTSMDGGRGSVFKSFVALVTLEMIINGFNLRGASTAIIAVASGVVLGTVIVYDAILLVRKNRIRGQRHELLDELAQLENNPAAPSDSPDPSPTPSEDDAMQRKEQVPLNFCLGALAALTVVSVTGMCFIYQLASRQPTVMSNTVASAGTGAAPAVSGDVFSLKSTDGQPLIFPEEAAIKLPPRPENPEALPQTDAGHWYDQEYAGWGITRVNPIAPPSGGPKGKKVIYLKFIDHPYLTAMQNGMQKVADHYGIEMKMMCAEYDVNLQAKQVDLAINEKPDLVIFNAVDAKGAAGLLRKLNEARIPVVASNQMCTNEGLAYTLTWCGPDDWGNNRNLARAFAEKMNYEGGYCIVRHLAGNACYDSRTWSIVSELAKIAPKMKLLDMQTSKLDKIETEKLVSGWITRFGPELKGITCSDDSGAQLGVNKACKDANRTDIIRVAAGNSKVGMDAVKSGDVAAITFQSAEGDGAIAMELAAEWFSGKKLPEVRYLPKGIITPKTVDRYLPAQW